LDINLVGGDEVVVAPFLAVIIIARQEAVVIVGSCWYCSPAAEAVESVVVELILDINPSELQDDVSEVDREGGRCRYMQKNQSVLDIRRKD
jgi:hypothetical protein